MVKLTVNDLFDTKKIEEKAKSHSFNLSDIFSKWNQALLKNPQNEEQLQADFLNNIFGEFLGYSYKIGEGEINLIKEEKTEIDGTKPDGILGFFSNNKKDTRVIIELKGQNINLDKKCEGRSPIDQAFSYSSKYQGVEWVIVSNFKEIRLYKTGFQGIYHLFKIEELAGSAEKQKEFHFLLAKDRLFVRDKCSSSAHNLLKDETGETIEKRFYSHYSQLRETIWRNLIDLNKEKKYGKNFYLYKAQKLIDRIIFIRFCKENGALDADKVKEALNNKLIKGKYKRIKALFNAMNEGNPEIGIAKFNGGLFAPDEDLDCLDVSDEMIDKIVVLYDYNFGSDLDLNILGHIFEQSISDLEELIQDNTKKRKKDGIFYTPAYITAYIIKEAVGGWLQNRKDEIQAKPNTTKWWEQYASHLKTIKVVDPACGSGAFLVKVFDYLQNEWKEVEKHIKPNYTYQNILTNNIYGVDINPASVGITKLSLWLKTAHHREPLTTLDNNVKIGNSLIDDKDYAGVYYEFEGITKQEQKTQLETQWDEKEHQKSLAFEWEKEFASVFANGGFDVVVGNPPYGADIDKYAKYFATNYPNSTKKHKDSYKLFIDKALQISKAKVGFIVPNTFLYQPRYEDIKTMINKHGNTVINLGEKIFENVELPTAILIIDKHKHEHQIADLRFVKRNEVEEKITNRVTLVDVEKSNHTIGKNIVRLDEVVIFKDAGMQYQRKGVGRINKWDGNMKERMEYEGIRQRPEDIMYFKGRDMDRYFIEEKTERFLKYNYKSLLQKNESASFNKEVYGQQKILIRQTASYIISVEDKSGIVFDRTIIAIINNSSVLCNNYILCILNSKYYKYLYMQKVLETGKVFPQVKLSYLKDLPFLRISPEEQQPFVQKAQQMMDLTKELKEFSSKFLKLLQADLGVAKITKKLEKWYNLPADKFFLEVGKQNPNLSLLQKSEWLQHFEEEKLKAVALQNQITKTDAEIDRMVYKLYGLTEEEIDVVERSL